MMHGQWVRVSMIAAQAAYKAGQAGEILGPSKRRGRSRKVGKVAEKDSR